VAEAMARPPVYNRHGVYQRTLTVEMTADNRMHTTRVAPLQSADSITSVMILKRSERIGIIFDFLSDRYVRTEK
jgi:hypothetical protein